MRSEVVGGHSDGTSNLVHISPDLSIRRPPALLYCILTTTAKLVGEEGWNGSLYTLNTNLNGE